MTVDFWTLFSVPVFQSSPRFFFFLLFVLSLIFGCAGLRCCSSLSLVVVSGAALYFSAQASPTGEHRPRRVGVSSCGSQAPQHRLNTCGPQACGMACGIFPGKGSNLYLLYWQADSLPLR